MVKAKNQSRLPSWRVAPTVTVVMCGPWLCWLQPAGSLLGRCEMQCVCKHPVLTWNIQFYNLIFHQNKSKLECKLGNYPCTLSCSAPSGPGPQQTFWSINLNTARYNVCWLKVAHFLQAPGPGVRSRVPRYFRKALAATGCPIDTYNALREDWYCEELLPTTYFTQ